MMTKQHFEAIAHTLDANVADMCLVLDFADMLEEQNDRFDRPRFVEAATKAWRRQQEAALFQFRSATKR